MVNAFIKFFKLNVVSEADVALSAWTHSESLLWLSLLALTRATFAAAMWTAVGFSLATDLDSYWALYATRLAAVHQAFYFTVAAGVSALAAYRIHKGGRIPRLPEPLYGFLASQMQFALSSAIVVTAVFWASTPDALSWDPIPLYITVTFHILNLIFMSVEFALFRTSIYIAHSFMTQIVWFIYGIIFVAVTAATAHFIYPWTSIMPGVGLLETPAEITIGIAWALVISFAAYVLFFVELIALAIRHRFATARHENDQTELTLFVVRHA